MENSKEKNVNLKQAFNDFLESITQYNKEIQSGFGFDHSPSGVAEAEKATEKAKNIIASFAAGPAYFAMNLYKMQYEQEFKFVTDPALRSIAGSMPGYYQILGNALADRERLSQQYRMIGLNSVINLSGTAVNLGIQASLRTTAGKSLLTQFASRTGARNLAAGAAGAAARAGAAGAAGAAARAGAARAAGIFLGPIGIALSTVFLLFEIFQVIQNFARNKDLIKNAENRSLMALFNPKPLMALYEKNAFLLGSPKPDNMGGMELLTGTAWEDELAEGKIPSTINSWSGSVYNSAFNADFSDVLTGVDVRGFGFDNQKVLAAVGNMSRNVQTGANEDVVAQILMMSGLYAGGDTSLMESISQDIIRSSGFTDQDVTQATERFEEFFAAVVGDGKPQASYLNLVEALSSFSYSYAMGTRANLDSSGAIAEIQQFMGDRGMINGRFDVKATQTAIMSIDEFLLQGATYQDLSSAQMLQSMDISREDAIRGVTYDSKTFEKFLNGLMDYLKVTNDDVLNETRNFDVSLQNFAMMTNISNEQLNAIMVALRRRASGYSVESVRTEYLENFADDVNDKLAPYKNFSSSYLNVIEVMSNITYSNNKYLDAIRLNLDTVQLFNQIILDVTEQGFSGSFARILQSLQEMVGISQEITGGIPSLGQRREVNSARAEESLQQSLEEAEERGYTQGVPALESRREETSANAAAARQAQAEVIDNATGMSRLEAREQSQRVREERQRSTQEQQEQDNLQEQAQVQQGQTQQQVQQEQEQSQQSQQQEQEFYNLSNNEKFEAALAFTERAEGGYSDNPDDKGNWTGGAVGSGELKGTKFGISAAAYPHLDIENLTIDEAKAIYKRDYWDKINGDSLPFPASIAIFDFAVNSGVSRSLNFWRTIESANFEHIVQFGEELPQKSLIRSLQSKRRSFIRGLESYEEFGTGWENRLNALDEEISQYLPGYTTGGKVSGFSLSDYQNFLNSPAKSGFKNMYISVPLQSKNPSMSASRFSELMSKYLS